MSEVPPDGWWYVQPETGYKMVALEPQELHEQIEKHRMANGLDLRDGWWEVVQAEICLRPGMAERFCPPDNVTRSNAPIKLKVRDGLKFFRALREWTFKSGFRKVSIKTATKRAIICGKCPHNTENVKGCVGCEGILRWLKEFLTPADKTGRESTLHFCDICKCALEIKIWLPPETLRGISDPKVVYPEENCWIAAIEKKTGGTDH